MVLSDCIVTVNELIFANMTVKFMENETEITVHLGGNGEAVTEIAGYFNKKELQGKIIISGVDEEHKEWLFKLSDPTEYHLNISPLFYVSISFKK
ncbi:hypothetical protein [Aneurinibacillus tyrosinisolvens]|uniref:hypothetical protein n=1 Tax=Aneurinibacillus tyrosinisolvens TaxID=1443435 RepID=UPI00063FC045|nr:hypothetical protein [Aneurinibacillus tyrosinisolvens]